MPPHSGAYTYDTAGNVTRIERDGRPTLDLTWNSQYQLVSVSTNGIFAEGYTYDALSRRVSTTTLEGTTRHVYDDNWQCIADIDEQGNVVASYVWGEGIDKLLAVTIGGATYYALTDIQGTVWGYVDSQNNIVAYWQYDAWGNVVDEEVSDPALSNLRYRFQCREWSATTGLINFRMRWYDAETGRWLSKDPIGLSGGLNLYAFCACSPLIKNDAWGLWTFQFGVSGTGGAGNGGTAGVGIVAGYSRENGFQFGVYGMIGDGAYISKGGGLAVDITISPNDDICDLNGVSQTIGGSGTTPIGVVGGELGLPLPLNDGPLPLPSLTGSWGVSTPLPEVHTFTTATGIHEIWRSR